MCMGIPYGEMTWTQRQRVIELCEHPSRVPLVTAAPACNSSTPQRRYCSTSCGLPCGLIARCYHSATRRTEGPHMSFNDRELLRRSVLVGVTVAAALLTGTPCSLWKRRGEEA